MGYLFGTLSLCVQLALFVILIMALSAVHNLGKQWEKEINDVDIYTVQDPRFWAPIEMLVPRDCTVFGKYASKPTALHEDDAHTSSGVVKLNTTNVSTDEFEFHTSLLGFPVIPDGLDRVGLANLLKIKKCGVDIEVPDVTGTQYYFAMMMTAQSKFDIDDLHQTRLRFFWFFAVCTVFQATVNVIKSVYTTYINPQQGPTEMEGKVAQGCGKICQKMVEKYQTIVMQLTFVSLFLTNWHENHYYMTYFPGRAFIIVYGLMFCMMCGGVAVLICGPENNPFAMCCMAIYGIGGCVCCIPVLLPFGIWGLYSLQFIFKMWEGIHDTAAFSMHFPEMTKIVGQVTQKLIGLNVVDMALPAFESVITSVEAAFAREPGNGDKCVKLLDNEGDDDDGARTLIGAAVTVKSN